MVLLFTGYSIGFNIKLFIFTCWDVTYDKIFRDIRKYLQTFTDMAYTDIIDEIFKRFVYIYFL